MRKLSCPLLACKLQLNLTSVPRIVVNRNQVLASFGRRRRQAHAWPWVLHIRNHANTLLEFVALDKMARIGKNTSVD